MILAVIILADLLSIAIVSTLALTAPELTWHD